LKEIFKEDEEEEEEEDVSSYQIALGKQENTGN